MFIDKTRQMNSYVSSYRRYRGLSNAVCVLINSLLPIRLLLVVTNRKCKWIIWNNQEDLLGRSTERARSSSENRLHLIWNLALFFSNSHLSVSVWVLASCSVWIPHNCRCLEKTTILTSMERSFEALCLPDYSFNACYLWNDVW